MFLFGVKTMNNENNKFLSTAFRASMFAGKFILENMGKVSKKDIDTKQASDFVTYVDRESEKIILSTIKNEFPDHYFLAEESVKDSETGEYRWIIDPLDGTTNFIHGYPVFSVSIALEFRREIILGLIYDPLRNEVFSAEKGKGSYLNGKKIMVSSITDPRESLITTGFPFRKKEMIDPYLRLFKNLFYNVSDIRRAGSAALDLAHLACGRCDGFFEIGLGPWDIAAGTIMIKESGGIVTDFSGGEDYMKTGNIVAGPLVIHELMIKEVTTVFKDIIDK